MDKQHPRKQRARYPFLAVYLPLGVEYGHGFRARQFTCFWSLCLKLPGGALLQMTSFDLILLLIISEATQQALLGEDFSITGAMITITTLVVVDIIFGLLKKYFSTVENILDGTPVILVENGVPLPIN